MTVERATLTKNCLPKRFERLALALGYGESCQSAQRCADSHLQMLLFTNQEIELSGNGMHSFDSDRSIFAVSSALKRLCRHQIPLQTLYNSTCMRWLSWFDRWSLCHTPRLRTRFWPYLIFVHTLAIDRQPIEGVLWMKGSNRVDFGRLVDSTLFWVKNGHWIRWSRPLFDYTHLR